MFLNSPPRHAQRQMDGVGGDDPFLWDVDATVRELSASGHPWARDPAALAARIQEEEVDGRTLLTYEHLCSRQELMECLGIRPARHKATLSEAIVNFRSKSREYQKWWQDFSRKQSGDFDTDEVETQIEKAPPLDEGQQQPLQSGHQLPAVTQSSPPPDHELKHSMQEDTNGERPVKRRRVVPVPLEARPEDIHPAFVPTEADLLALTTEPAHQLESALALGHDTDATGTREFPWETAPSYAYIGNGRIDNEEIISPTGALTSRLLEYDEGTFATVVPNKLPHGRRLVANQQIKKFLIGNSLSTTLLSRSSSPESTQSDEIIDLAEEPEDLEPETLKEIEDEKLEKERLEALQPPPTVEPSISKERVSEILDEIIKSMEATWRDTKLPKCQRKAHGLWKNARRTGTKIPQILEAHNWAERLHKRIEDLCKEILKNTYTTEAPIRDQAKCLEGTVQDKSYHMWLIDMLGSSAPPPKPQSLPRPQQAKKQREIPPDEEELTSSDEEDFIVPEDEPIPGEDSMDIEHEGLLGESSSFANPLKEESPMSTPECIDLTQTDPVPPTPVDNSKRAFIDLTSPAKSADSPQPSPQKDDDIDGHIDDPPPPPDGTVIPPAIELLGKIQEIGSVSPNKWVDKDDRWRLLISLIWNLDHSRRRAILDTIQSQPPDALWDGPIKSYLSKPFKSPKRLTSQNPETVGFDLVRLFRSFFKCRNTTESGAMRVKNKKLTRQVTEARGKWFTPFCTFIKALIPEFPEDSQIYRNDILDEFFPIEAEDELDDLEDDLEDDGGAKTQRRRVPKEIIRNKEAVDARERAREREQEAAARAMKLRRKLASSSLMPEDRTRLIVNESKDEGQSLIYINDDIGRRIKDHQIDGVRFLWNQIVLDPDTRHGCLLAHTMGLGKTMQTIAFLVVLAEAAASEDPSVVAQIPEDLRVSRTLVISPTAVVDNWLEELDIWDPDGILGKRYKITAAVKRDHELHSTVSAWASGGGVLVIGYELLTKILGVPGEVTDLLLQSPNVVIADEAHRLKNTKTKVYAACLRFETKTRIALTGSPLANHVIEYYTMIDWIVPNFLGPLPEFNQIYNNPIQEGLFNESDSGSKRRALRALELLKQLVEPIVHRRTIAAVKAELPPKCEFIITVPPTGLQKKLYNTYYEGVINENGGRPPMLFGPVNDLALVCSHPRCFQAKVKRVQKEMAKVNTNAKKDDVTETDAHSEIDDQWDNEDQSDAEAILEPEAQMQGDGGKKNGKGRPKMQTLSFPKSVISDFLKALNVPDLGTPSLSWKSELLTAILDEARAIGDKVLVFSQSLDTLNYLENMCKMQQRRVSRLDGSTRPDSRQQLVKSFNEGTMEVALISTTAGGIGLNIQGANRVVIYDIKWNPTLEQQAVGRAFRIGQKRTVFVYRFLVAGTLEASLYNKHVFKMQLANRVVDKKNPLAWSKRKGEIIAPINPVPADDLKGFLGKDRILDKLIGLKKNGEAIRSIISTDTFEEEDPTATLTAEELKEIEDLVKLRSTNPEEYQRTAWQVDSKQQEELLAQHGPFRPALLLPSHGPVHQSFDGASDLPSNTETLFSVAQHTHSLAMSGVGPVPLPMAGANTFFGEHPRPVPSQTPTTGPITATATTAPNKDADSYPRPAAPTNIFKGGGLFNVSEIPAKVEFEKHLRERVRNLQQRDVPRTGGHPEEIARALTDRVDEIRKEKSFGFLPDTQHWKHLDELLSHDKFVIAIIAGHLSAEYMALAHKQDLEGRIQTINGLEEMDIPAQARRRINSPDPNNLLNIQRRSLQRGDARPLARDDEKVMREAMDKRKSRAFRLPPWANQALHEEQKRASPAAETRERQAGSRNGTPRGG
ncbi:DNA repair rhp54 [Fusarium albosuccineum]|uniref:DNA repair rhp54 n=1 Tax=Fusarium albosuccineum TaxID=1237068 RepID=A0A8H4P8D3_9HYPO|nr:DNA repair rhp54 [Fusarium albosuccineum]